VRHRYGHELVRHDQRAGAAPACGLEARERLHEGREVGAGVAEEDVDAAVLQQLEVRLGRRLGVQDPKSHRRTS
jgi:hypothetical protein